MTARSKEQNEYLSMFAVRCFLMELWHYGKQNDRQT